MLRRNKHEIKHTTRQHKNEFFVIERALKMRPSFLIKTSFVEQAHGFSSDHVVL